MVSKNHLPAHGPANWLLISHTYPPVVGGSEIEAQRISAALIARGHRVQVLCTGGPPMPAQRNWVDAAGVPVSILTRRSRGRIRDLVFACRVAWHLWSHRQQYDVVYFLMQGLHLAAGLPVARLLGKPFIMKFGGSGVIPAVRQSRIGAVELNWLRRWAARILILNEGMVDEAIADGFRRDQLTWMPNPVSVEDFRPVEAAEVAALRARHNIPPHAFVVTYVGRLSPVKDLPLLLRAFAQLAAQAPESMLILVGDGEQRAELEAQAGELRLPSVQLRLVGRVDSAEIPQWLQLSDVFALPSPSEGFSCALLEAMAAGLPSVVSDIPANRQLIQPGVHGLAAPAGDAGAITEALLRLYGDPALRQRMGVAARASVIDRFSTAKVADRYEQLLAEMVAGRRARDGRGGAG